MTVKEHILEIFESSKGEFLSGGELAARLGVSRNAVWKAVKQLQAEGYVFDSVSGRGYRLHEESDVLSEQGIRKYLGSAGDKLDLRVYQTITSTNTVLKEMAAEGAPEFTVLVAAEQTAGRGRMNRQFYSPTATGLYLSILLRPQMKAEEALFITTAAAVAVARVVEEVSGRPAGIKWVNDVFVDGKKVCGILTEAAFDMESGALEYAVAGIGVNISDPEGGFPDEIRDIAASVFGTEPPPADARNKMAAGILRYFTEYYENLPAHTFFADYVSRSVVIGQDIFVLGKGEPRPAKALAIDQNCNLRVRYADGQEELLSSGEISVRLMRNSEFGMRNY